MPAAPGGSGLRTGSSTSARKTSELRRIWSHGLPGEACGPAKGTRGGQPGVVGVRAWAAGALLPVGRTPAATQAPAGGAGVPSIKGGTGDRQAKLSRTHTARSPRCLALFSDRIDHNPVGRSQVCGSLWASQSGAGVWVGDAGSLAKFRPCHVIWVTAGMLPASARLLC